MPAYIALMSWTDQGARSAANTVGRFRDSRDMLARMHVRIRDIHWTTGRYDVVALIDAPDDQTVAAAALAIAGQGNLRTEILRAFNEQEMEEVVQRVAF